MAARGRTPGFRMTDEHRVKIQNSNILNALIEHTEGRREMSATQVSAGIGLLRKVLPDLSATTISGDDDNPLKVEIALDAERFTSSIASLSARSAASSETS